MWSWNLISSQVATQVCRFGHGGGGAQGPSLMRIALEIPGNLSCQPGGLTRCLGAVAG